MSRQAARIVHDKPAPVTTATSGRPGSAYPGSGHDQEFRRAEDGLRRRAAPGCASPTRPGRFAPGNQHAGHELWVGGGAVPGVTGAVNLKKWHQHPPAGRTR
jgi:hypothetical protein